MYLFGSDRALAPGYVPAALHHHNYVLCNDIVIWENSAYFQEDFGRVNVG